MKTFEVKAAHPDHKHIRIVCWAWSRNDTRFDIQFDRESILSKHDSGSIRTYAGLHVLSSTNWVARKVNEALGILYPDAPPISAGELETTLLKAINVCEGKYGYYSALEGDSEVVFILEGETP